MGHRTFKPIPVDISSREIALSLFDTKEERKKEQLVFFPAFFFIACVWGDVVVVVVVKDVKLVLSVSAPTLFC